MNKKIKNICAYYNRCFSFELKNKNTLFKVFKNVYNLIENCKNVILKGYIKCKKQLNLKKSQI